MVVLRFKVVDQPSAYLKPEVVAVLPVVNAAPSYQFCAVVGTTATLTTGLNYAVALLAIAN